MENALIGQMKWMFGLDKRNVALEADAAFANFKLTIIATIKRRNKPCK